TVASIHWAIHRAGHVAVRVLCQTNRESIPAYDPGETPERARGKPGGPKAWRLNGRCRYRRRVRGAASAPAPAAGPERGQSPALRPARGRHRTRRLGNGRGGGSPKVAQRAACDRGRVVARTAAHARRGQTVPRAHADARRV